MFRFRTIAFLAALLFLRPCVQAGEASYLHYTVDEGLPSNEVYDVYEDSLGYIWFATDHGISRFDGYAFKNYSTNDGLVHNTIFGFYEDHRGWIWMRAFNGAMCYMENGIIKPYAHNAKLKAFLGRNFVQRYAFDRSGNLWFVPAPENPALYVQDARTGEIRQKDIPAGYNAFIRVLDSGELIAGIDFNNGISEHSTIDDSVVHSSSAWYFRIAVTPHSVRRQVFNYKQLGAEHFVFSYDHHLLTLEQGRITHRRTYNEIVNRMYADSDGQLWLCMTGFRRCVPGVAEEEPYLGEKFGTSMLRDRMGNHWFATLDDGVYLARELQVSAATVIAGLPVEEITALQPFHSSAVVMDKNGTFFQLPVDSAAVHLNRAVMSMCPEVPQVINTFHISEEKSLLYVQNMRFRINDNGIDARLPLRPSSTDRPAAVRDIWDTGDSIYVAGNTAWAVFDWNDRCFHSSTRENFTAFFTAVAVGKDGMPWIGTNDGLFTYTAQHTVPYKSNDPLYRQRVTDIVIGTSGEVIVSTRGGGLVIIDKDTTYNVRAADGLATDQCGNLHLVDSVLWICSNNGLTKMIMRRTNDVLSFHCQRFGLQHGLPSAQINDVLQVNNLLFMATAHGLAWLDAERFTFNQQTPAVYINSFQANNREMGLDSTRLAWNERNVTIGFIGLLFKSPGLVQYRYKLDGYEDEWHYTTDRVAHYYNLPAGAYTFLVSAMNENGIWSRTSARKVFEIPMHYTETLWFSALIYAGIVLVLAGIFLLYLRQQRAKNKSVLELALAEQKALRAQMKPHFIFNSLNSIQHFILNRDEESAHIYLTSFAQLMRRILDHSQTGLITLEEETESLRLYLDLEKLRFGENFSYSISIPSGISASVLMIPPLFIQPFAENAIWHGLQMQKNSPTLEIRFETENNMLHCVIEDNGIGRKRAAAFRKKGHTSTGMKNVEERIALLNSTSREKISLRIHDLNDAEGNPTGTRVEIWFPFVRNDEI
jgi:ligand-binding sensor domain-containing protein